MPPLRTGPTGCVGSVPRVAREQSEPLGADLGGGFSLVLRQAAYGPKHTFSANVTVYKGTDSVAYRRVNLNTSDRTDFAETVARETGLVGRVIDAELLKLTDVAVTEASPAGVEDRPEVISPDERLPVDIGEQDLTKVTPELWSAVRERNDPVHLFKYGGALVRYERDELGNPVLGELTPDRLRYEVARSVYCFRIERRGSSPLAVSAKPPADLMHDMLATPNPPLPPLTRLVQAPVFAPDGTLQTEPGYHPAGSTYYEPAGPLTIADIASHPTTSGVQDARSLLMDDLLGDFPFEGDADKAHALSLLLLPFSRDLIDGSTPLHLLEAPSPGTGKGLLVDACLFPGVGASSGVTTEARDDDEWRKKLTTELLSGKPVIHFDNILRPLTSGHLAAVLTTPMWRDRRLGQSNMISVPVRCLFVATANNPTMSTEIARRTVRIRLDSRTDRPWQRSPNTFRHPQLLQWARDNRARLIHASLTLIQAWLAAGRPSANSRPLGSFEQWSAVIGGILQLAGVPGFLGNVDALYERVDAEGARWRAFTAAWWDKFEESPRGTAELFPIAEGADDFELRGSTEKAQRTSFGKQLSAQQDRIFGEFRIESAGKEHQAARWRLRRMPASQREENVPYLPHVPLEGQAEQGNGPSAQALSIVRDSTAPAFSCQPGHNSYFVNSAGQAVCAICHPPAGSFQVLTA
jgi:putative DNA primase/helicase